MALRKLTTALLITALPFSLYFPFTTPFILSYLVYHGYGVHHEPMLLACKKKEGGKEGNDDDDNDDDDGRIS